MTDLGGTVDVGDQKTLEIASTDGSGNPLDAAAEVEVTSPSGEQVTYTNADMTESGDKLFLRLTFDEAGYWHVRIKASNAGGQEAEEGFIRAIIRKPVDLSLLTADAWPEYLSESAMQEGPSELEPLIEKAERKTLGRYREVDNRNDLILDAHYDSDIQLDGYVEDDQGNPDLKNMDQGLLDALRATVSEMVEFWLRKPDEAEHVESKGQGDRSVTFRDKDLPTSVYAPLRPYDERAAWH